MHYVEFNRAAHISLAFLFQKCYSGSVGRLEKAAFFIVSGDVSFCQLWDRGKRPHCLMGQRETPPVSQFR